METIRITIQRWFDRQDKRWRDLSLERQRSYTLGLFLAYLLLTALLILKVWHDIAGSDSRMVIEHIGNTVRKKGNTASPMDTQSTTVKEKTYERK